MGLEIKVEKHSNYCKVSLIGACTIYTGSKLKTSLLEVIQANENILIDLGGVVDFDTAGLQIFISAKNFIRLTQKKIKLTSHPVCVLSLLDLYGLVSFFGDKVVLTQEEKKHFQFQYGTKKLPSFVY